MGNSRLLHCLLIFAHLVSKVLNNSAVNTIVILQSLSKKIKCSLPVVSRANSKVKTAKFSILNVLETTPVTNARVAVFWLKTR